MASIQERVIKVLADQLGVRMNDIKPDTLIRDLGADSLDDVEVVMALEDEFEKEIPDEQAEKLGYGTVQGIVDYLETRLQPTPPVKVAKKAAKKLSTVGSGKRTPQQKYQSVLTVLGANYHPPAIIKKEITAYLKTAKRFLLKQPLVLSVGDRVMHTTRWAKGEPAIVNKVVLNEDGSLSYGTTRGAWFKRNELKLTAYATHHSLKEAANRIHDQ